MIFFNVLQWYYVYKLYRMLFTSNLTETCSLTVNESS